MVGLFVGWLASWLAVGWLAGWLVGWLAGWLVGWLGGWWVGGLVWLGLLAGVCWVDAGAVVVVVDVDVEDWHPAEEWPWCA